MALIVAGSFWACEDKTVTVDGCKQRTEWQKMDSKARFAIRRYASLEAMKADEYACWQQRPAHERMAAVTEITAEAYRLKDSSTGASRLQRALVHLKR